MSLSRRAFLRGAAGAALALPLLQLPAGRSAAAQRYPKRLLLWFTPNGTLKELWSPQGGTETQFDLPQLLQPLARHQDKLVVIDGVDLAAGLLDQAPGGPHQRGIGALFTGDMLAEGDLDADGCGRRAGWANNISVDQAAIQALAPNTRFQSLELGVQVKDNNTRSRIVYRAPQQPLPPEVDPVAAYRRVFAGMDMSTDELQRQFRRRRSVLDSVWRDFSNLQSKVAAPDRHKLEAHASSLRDLENRLSQLATAQAQCQPMPTPPPMAHMDEAFFDQVGRLQMDLMVTAMACDLTRFGSIQWSSAVNAIRFTFMGIRDYDGHSLSHGGDSNDVMRNEWVGMLTFYAEQFSYLLDKLDSVQEGDGTLLDNTLVLWGNELSRGNSHDLHDIPFLLAGKAGGAIRTGRHLTYDHQPNNNLLLSVLHALDVNATSFGNRELCTGDLPGLLG
jgi:hypothetical protein